MLIVVGQVVGLARDLLVAYELSRLAWELGYLERRVGALEPARRPSPAGASWRSAW
jgi:hypothetical protein